ncbi:MAG: GIY-YIG nuclease family protein [Clostridiales bacterium]|nr:GIY-YIG nuclease family protein [Clostridiales bacterium]
MNFTYILECKGGSYYTGWTNDIIKRLAAHRSGHGAKYTRGRGPLNLVYLEAFDTKEEAMHREAYIKGLPRPEKENLIRSSDWMSRLDEWELNDLEINDPAGKCGLA